MITGKGKLTITKPQIGPLPTLLGILGRGQFWPDDVIAG